MDTKKLCECGCGGVSPLATKTNSKRGREKGQPVRFIVGHAARKRQVSISFGIDKKTGCWLWRGSKISTGYGNLRVGGKDVLAHRYMYQLIKGEIPKDLELDHLCRNSLCINPSHLEAVTHAENCRRGKRAKLTRKAVIEIKAMKAVGFTITAISEKYGVGRHTVRSAITGKAWVCF